MFRLRLDNPGTEAHNCYVHRGYGYQFFESKEEAIADAESQFTMLEVHSAIEYLGRKYPQTTFILEPVPRLLDLRSDEKLTPDQIMDLYNA